MKKVPQNLRDRKRVQQIRPERKHLTGRGKIWLLKSLLLGSLRIKCLKALLYAGVVDTQELVLSSGHVDEIGFALAAFPIEELVDWLICRGFFQVSADNLVECFAQMC